MPPFFRFALASHRLCTFYFACDDILPYLRHFSKAGQRQFTAFAPLLQTTRYLLSPFTFYCLSSVFGEDIDCCDPIAEDG